MITPGDITEELIEQVSERCGMYPGAWDCVDSKEIAVAILNAAIEAGLVSPPVWAVICEASHGEFVADMLPTQFEAEMKWKWRKDRIKHAKYRVEHWKGQTK